MDLFERIIFFTIGAGVGFILGYVVARLHIIEMKVDDVKQEVHEVDLTVKHKRDERGLFQLPSPSAFIVGLVVLITAYAAFAASQANNKLEDTVACLTDFNTNQNTALTTRDEAIQVAADAEIALWGLYNKLYKEGTLPNTSPERIEEIQDTLAKAIREYRKELIDTEIVRESYEYDDPNILQDCERKQDE